MTTTDLKLVDGDLVIENGDLVLATGRDVVLESIRIDLATNLGDWVFDTEVGLDYFGVIFTKPVDLPGIEAAITARLLEKPEVTFVRVVDARFTDREVSVELAFVIDLGGEEGAAEVGATATIDTTGGEMLFFVGQIGGIV